jgi:ABC-type phosphate/phosphonate transport system substrate-binding protein
MWLPKGSFPAGLFLLACAATAFLAGGEADGRQAKKDFLRIGTSGTLGPKTDKSKEKAATETLKSFIQDETGMAVEILPLKNWHELANQLAAGKLQVGVFQGSEFAWAKEKYAGLKPLAVAINGYRYPVAYAVVKRTNPAKDFAALKGQTLSIPATGQDFLRLFVDAEGQAAGQKTETFFSKITTPASVDAALDNVVDGVVQVAVADRSAIEVYKQQKPGRFKQLKSIAHSQPFPPPVIAYFDKGLDAARRQRFEQGLVNASKNAKGKLMLALFHLTSFETVPNDFATVLEKFRKNYPAPKLALK